MESVRNHKDINVRVQYSGNRGNLVGKGLMWKYRVMLLTILYESTSQIVMYNPICSRQKSTASVWEEAYTQSGCGAQKLSSQTLENQS